MKKNKLLLIALLFVASCGIVLPVRAAEEEKPFDVKETIFEHLLDEYGWKMPFSKTAKLHLPIIVRDREGQWHVFSSSRLENGNVHNGFYIAHDGENKHKVEAVDAAGSHYRPLDLSITKNVLALFITAALLLWVFLSLARFYRKDRYRVPRGLLGAFDALVDMIYHQVIFPTLGGESKRFAPYLLTLFFFIFFANVLGLMVVFPAGANLTGNIAVTLVLATITFVVVNIFGTKAYWHEIFWPEVPLWLKFPIPIMPVIEVFGVITKPVALLIRLFANMLGGHMIILVLISLIFLFGAMGSAVVGATTVVSVGFSLFMMLIDTLISFIQAYVFTLLSTLFIGLARVKE